MGMVVAKIVLIGVLHTINNLNFPFSSYLFITEYFSIRYSGCGVRAGRYPRTTPHTHIINSHSQLYSI